MHSSCKHITHKGFHCLQTEEEAALIRARRGRSTNTRALTDVAASLQLLSGASGSGEAAAGDAGRSADVDTASLYVATECFPYTFQSCATAVTGRRSRRVCTLLLVPVSRYMLISHQTFAAFLLPVPRLVMGNLKVHIQQNCHNSCVRDVC